MSSTPSSSQNDPSKSSSRTVNPTSSTPPPPPQVPAHPPPTSSAPSSGPSSTYSTSVSGHTAVGKGGRKSESGSRVSSSHHPFTTPLLQGSTSVRSSQHGLSNAAAPAFYPPELHIQPYPYPTSQLYLEQRPSFLKSSKGYLIGDRDMPGVDENIYHWKVLNLSRAKLKASSRTSALLSGFAMVAMVEIQIDEKVPEPLLITFAVCTVLLIAVHMLALMISTCILPNVEAVANLHYQTKKTVFESPHMKMSCIVELAWGFSTVLGILLFLVEIAILCWVKFYTLTHAAAWVATGLLIPIMCVFIGFAALFYLKLVSHKSEVYEDEIKELQLLKDQLEDQREDCNSPSPGSSRRGAVQIV